MTDTDTMRKLPFAIAAVLFAWCVLGRPPILATYLFIGLHLVARDYALPLHRRPLYALENKVWLNAFEVLFWPIPRIAMKLQERRWRRRP